MFKKIAFGLVAVVVVLLAFAATRPDTFRVQRSTTIKVPPAKLFALLSDFQKFGAWSPWEKLDPAMKRSFSGPASGPGSVYAWEGNDAVGAGRMEILQTVPDSKVVIKLDFLKPFEAHNTTGKSGRPATTLAATLLRPEVYAVDCYFCSDCTALA
ncbi:SRPBCC family protein [Rhodoferax sp.]|uniref:SRPBCC family protein n=1 Tax=Rhodoferax sp. TaxID=50421 RepID=UPI002761D2CD|nr:SRPBCC family protein [Rhodoferax sp.]